MRIYKHRRDYWSCSKFAKYVRSLAGIESPFALTLEDWDSYKDDYKKKAPFTYFLVETVFNAVQDFILFPVDVIKSIGVWYSNAIKNKVHYLRTGLERGVWYDTDFRLLCAVMNALVDFIEIEYAWCYTWDETEGKKYEREIKLNGRSPEAAKKYVESILNAEYEPYYETPKCDLEVKYNEDFRVADERRKDVVRELYEIYLWWKDYFKVLLEYGDQDVELENKYLKRVIELRGHLWT